MTIVTKNSLTISNVNDGTITHYAYANSADGKDGFYIGGGTNLLQGTQDFSGSNWLNLGSVWKKTDETYNGLSVAETTSDWSGIAQYYQVKQDETYTFSLFARYTSGTGKSNIFIELNNDPENGHKKAQIHNNYLDCFLDTNWKKCSITFTATSDGYVKPRMERSNNNTNVLRVCGFMFEEGTVAHPWSPAPSEAHPSYIGQYTDFNTTASTDPAKYAPWIVFKGKDGLKGDTGGILGENMWIGHKYSYSGSTRIYPSFEHIQGITPVATRIFDDSTQFTFNDDYYIAHFQSNLYVNIDKQITTTVAHDDDLTIYCNDEVIVSKNTTIFTPYNITFNLKAGWNKIDILLHEIVGGDQVAFGTKLSSLVEHLSYIKGADGQNSYTHTAYAWSSDGTDRFTNVYPNLNLLDGTKDFSGNWLRTGNWTNDGTYKGLTVKKKTSQWDGINKIFTASKDGFYTFSAYVKSSGNTANIFRYCGINSTSANAIQRQMGNNFDWIRDSVTLNLKANDAVWVRYEISGSGTDSILWTAGHKWEQGSTATPYIPSFSEVKTSDYPSYIGTYSDDKIESSLDYSKYQWAIFKGQNSNAYTAYSWSSDGTDRFSNIYPNLNLSNNTQLNYDDLPTGISNGGGTDKSEKVAINDLAGFSWGRKYTPSTRVAQSGMRVVTDVSKLKIGDTITNSFWVKNTGNRPVKFIPQMGFRYGADTEPNKGVSTGWNYVGGSDIEVKNDGKWTKLTFTTIIPQPTVASNRTGDILKSVVHYAYSSGAMMPLAVTDTFIISPLKLELGSISTPWMPSESEAQDQWQDAIPMYVGVGEKDSQNPTDYRWQLNPRYVQASSDSGLSNKAGLDDLASVADTANDALVQAQNAVSNEDYTSWLEHDYQTTINNLQDVSAQNQEDINNVDDRTTIVEGFYGEMKVKWNFIDESFTFSEEGMFISNAQSKMAIQVTSDKIVFWDNDVDVAFITGEVLNIQKGVFLESATIGNHLITKFSDDSPVTIIRYVGGIT